MKRFFRWFFYALGVFVLALGIILNSKTGLGISPLLSVSFSISEIWGLNLGVVNCIFYILLIGGEILLYKRVTAAEIMQLPFSFAFNYLVNIFTTWITYDHTRHSVGTNLALLCLGIVLTGFGICLTVNMRLASNPGDGITYALAWRLKWEHGFAKNVTDVVCVSTTCLIGLIFAGKIVGVGLGTVASMLCIGRVVAVVNYLFRDKMCRLAGVTVALVH